MGVSGRRVGRVVVVLAAVAVCGLAVSVPPSAADATSASAVWTWPLAGPPPVARAFAPPEIRYGPGHRGVDVAGAPGASVLAAGAGTVSYAGLLAGRGVVVVQHGELRTTYEPVTAQVAVGQQVAAGDVLGRLVAGHAGCRVTACLHWGLRRGETYLDPLSLVGAGPVRLLPAGVDRGGTGQAALRAPSARAQAPPEPEPAPGLDLRAAASPSGALAVLALLAGLALLARPGPPHRPSGGSAAEGRRGSPSSSVRDQPAADPPGEVHDGRPSAPVLDLGRERARRAAGR